MKNLISFFAVVVALSFGIEAAAQPEWAAIFGLEGRFEDGPNSAEKELHSHIYFGSQAQWSVWRWQSELGLASESSGEGMVNVELKTYEWFNWAHYVFRTETSFRFYTGAGIGLTIYKTKTTAGGASRTTTSDINFDLGFAGGIERTFRENILAGFEVRIYKIEAKKDPIYSGLFQVGYLF